MKRYLSIGLITFFYFTLISCAHHRYPYIDYNLTYEGWMHEVDTNPRQWALGADSWFLTGEPNWAERVDRNAPYSAAISTMAVKVPNFRNIKIMGDFQVQIFGTYDHSSVYVLGPNEDVRKISIEVRGNTLCITQAKAPAYKMKQVIIRIGMNELNNLNHMGGCGTIEGVQLRSRALRVTSAGCGNIYLAGDLNLQFVGLRGGGSVNVFGANTRSLDIAASGGGSVNVSGGRVGLRTITHHGMGNVNVIGAMSSGLKIYADGRGKIGINGPVTIRSIQARNYTRVLAYPVSSGSPYIYVYDQARVGLAGYANDLYVNTFGNSFFYGRYFCVRNAFVRAYDNSHMNVSSTNTIFASSMQNSSVYFFGSPDHLSQFVSGNGTVIPIWGKGMNSCVAYSPYSYKGETRYHRVSPYRWRNKRLSYKGEG